MPRRPSRFLLAVTLAIAALSTASLSSQPRTLTLRLVVVASPGEAERIAARARAGESMAALAAAASIDPTASSGGLLGPIDPETLRPELRDALRGLRSGEVTPVVAVATGYAVAQIVAEGADGAAAGAVNPGLAAIGSVKYVLNVAGLNEADAAFEQLPKPAGWSRDPRLYCEARRSGVERAVSSITDALKPGPMRSRLSQGDLAQVHYALGQLHAHDGRMDAAIEQFTVARDVTAASTSPGDQAVLQLDETLGVAWLHKAEMDNDVYRQPGARCLLTSAGLPPLAHRDAAVKAIEHFRRYLAHRPDDLEVRWLLNIASMAAGSYPQGVPAAQLIPGRAFASAEDVGRFVDVADEAGLRSFSMAGGVIVDDFDGDGRFDVVTSSFDACTPMRFFRRRADGGFEEMAGRAGLDGQIGGLSLMQADYDNDGCLDILLMRGAWQRPQRRSLLRNTCKGGFTDVTEQSGLLEPVTSTQAAVWTDIDNDGFLDLFVPNEAAPALLYWNQRDGTFKEIGRFAGVDKTAFSKGSAALDYDNDGWQDLYVSNLSGENFLYHNNRDRTFTEVAGALGVRGSGRGFGTWAFDYDNDGWQDLFATSYFFSVDETARTYLGLPHNATTLKLYRNLGGKRFQDVTAETGLEKVFMPMGANFGDLDNDGFLDIYLGTGNPSYASLVPSVLLRNRGGTAFVDVTASSGTGELHKGHGVAFADLDQDGDEEIVFEVGGAVPGDAHALRLFRNPGHGNDWLDLELVGVRSNRRGVGARIAVTVESGGTRRTMHRTVGSGGSFGASPLTQHVGLGRVDRIVAVEIHWPATGTRQRFIGIAKNRTLRIREDARDYVTVARSPLPLGGGSTRARTPVH